MIETLTYEKLVAAMEQTLTDLFNSTIEEHHANQTELCRGLCSNATLTRYLSGERRMDRLLLSAMMQRLGKSPDKFVSVLTDAEYRYFDWRLQVLNRIADRDWSGLERLILDRETADKELNEPLQEQFTLMVRGLLQERLRGDREGATDYFRRAVCATIPGFRGLLRPQCMLCVQEISALLLWQEYYGDEEISAALMKFLIDYVYEYFEDEQERVKVYPRLVSAYLPYLQERNRDQEIYVITGRAFRMMLPLRYFLCGEQLLNAYIESAEKLGKGQEVAKRKEQLASWREMRKELWSMDRESGHMDGAGVMSAEGALTLQGCAGSTACTVQREDQPADGTEHGVKEAEAKEASSSYADNWLEGGYIWDLWQEPELLREVIERRRKQRGLTQEVLSEGICTPETLSRIVTGKRAPSRRNFRALTKKLEVRSEYYYSVIEAKDFRLLEERFRLDALIETKQWQKAKKAAGRLKAQLDMESRYNRQYLGEIYYLIELALKGIPEQERVGRLLLLLSLTISDYTLTENVREWPEAFWCTVFTSEEISIMLQVINALRCMGELGDGIYLAERLYAYYHMSAVRPEFHFRTFMGVLAQLSILLGREERNEECIRYSYEGIALCFASRKMTDMGLFVNNIANANERLGDKAFALRHYRYAFYCEELLGNNSDIPRKSYEKLCKVERR